MYRNDFLQEIQIYRSIHHLGIDVYCLSCHQIITIMGTLGCIHDMMRRDKENRELRRRNRERMKETRRRMTECRHTEIPPTLSVEKLEEIKRQTQKKEQADQNHAFRIKLIVGLVMLVLLLLCGLLL